MSFDCAVFWLCCLIFEMFLLPSSTTFFYLFFFEHNLHMYCICLFVVYWLSIFFTITLHCFWRFLCHSRWFKWFDTCFELLWWLSCVMWLLGFLLGFLNVSLDSDMQRIWFFLPPLYWEFSFVFLNSLCNDIVYLRFRRLVSGHKRWKFTHINRNFMA